MIGYGAIFVALVLSCIAVFSYFNAHMAQATQRAGRRGTGGRTWFYAAAVCVAVAAAYLLYIIVTDQFQFAYVAGYSSRELSLAYKLSVFWAGQQGSFMLWLVFHAVFGLILARKNTVPGVMAVYSVLQAILLVILLAKSPFMLLAKPSADGVGLNPLLQDPWMVVHPPVVFLGYAGLAVPFAYAMEGLMSKKHKEWLTAAMPWTLFSWAALGAGIFIGGFWAYKVLGWGGYWAWDPVENSSLVPWLLAGVLVHCLVLGRIRPAGIKLAYFAGIFSFASVLYGTFLTRSGILSDFSTHAFSDEGIGSLLAGFVLLTVAAALVLLIMRWPGLPQGELFPGLNSREFLLAATALVLAVLAVVVFIGMSTPLVTMLLGNPQSVNTSFYNTMALPLAAVLAVLLTVMPILVKRENYRQYWWLAVILVAGMYLPLSLGLKQPLLLITVGFSCGAIISNLLAGAKKLLSWPAAVTHIGLAAMIIGIVISSAGGQSSGLIFEKGQTRTVLGQNITYLGAEKAEHGLYQNFVLDLPSGKVNVRPYTKLSKAGNPAAREPGIYRGLTADLYIAPSMQEEDTASQEISLHKGEETAVDGLKLKFVKIGMSGMGSNEVHVQTELEVTKDTAAETITPELTSRNGQISGNKVKAFGRYEIMLYSVSPSEGAAIFALRDLAAAQQDKVEVEISAKPLMNVVWLGAMLITVGTTLAALKRMAG